jgi:hypothetical protein
MLTTMRKISNVFRGRLSFRVQGLLAESRRPARARIGYRVRVACSLATIIVSLANPHFAFAQAGVVHQRQTTVDRPEAIRTTGTTSSDLCARCQAKGDSAVPSLAEIRAAQFRHELAVDSSKRTSHVGAGVLVAIGVGVIYGLYRANSQTPGCRAESCQGPQSQLIIDPAVFGAVGGFIGGLTMWVWSQQGRP